MFGIDLARTTPYNPQANGVIERMYATSESMLRKAHTQGLNWVGQIPFALFALRQMPSRTTGFSPYELVYGRHIRTPLDVLYAGWKAKDFEKLNACEWTCQLAHRLECLRDVAALRSKNERKEGYDKGKSDRKLEIGGKVWCRIPGRNGKLEDSWDGPYVVEKILSDVNYRVRECEGKKRSKTVHINSTKNC